MKPLSPTLLKSVLVLLSFLFFNALSLAQDRTADSLALVALYDETNGPGWINSAGWTDSVSLDNWYGVSMSGNRVTKLDLSSNNLFGQIPGEIGNADALDTLNLSANSLRDSIPNEITNVNSLISLQLQGNELYWSPDLTVMSSLIELDISDNNFEFDDIIPLIGISAFTYSPQKQFGSQLDTAVVVGDNFTIVRTSPGAGNTYQWQKDDIDISGDTTETLQILNFSAGDSARYNLIVTNSSAPSLTLSSNDINVALEDTTYFKAVQVSAFQGDGSNLASGWGDFNNDGFEDLFALSDTRLFYNNGDGTFTPGTGDPISNDITSFGPTIGDYDNDGDLDIYLASAAGSKLFTNDGFGNFNEFDAGELSTISGDFQGYSWADFDNDGYLDLYVTAGANIGGEVNYLFRNNQDGTLSAVTFGQIATDFEGSVHASWADYDGDGDQDLYVLNQNSPEPNSLYRNNGNGSFSKVFDNEIVFDTFGSFSSSWGDYNNDGAIDLFVVNNFNDPVLFENDGAGNFIRHTGVISIGNAVGSSWGDINSDGLLDLMLTSFEPANHLYLNNGDGTFTEVTDGSFRNASGFYGNSFADYNNDGQLDFVTRNGDWVLYENTHDVNNYLKVKLEGQLSNFSAIGAKIRVKANIGGGDIWQMREISAQTGLFAQNSLIAHFGIGDAITIDSVIVEWPSGIHQSFGSQSINQTLTITEEASPVMAADSLALIALYDSTGGDNWGNNANWKSGPVDSWYGVTAVGGRVLELKLNNNNLNGRIPPQLGDLDALTRLELQGNGLYDQIPIEIGSLINLNALFLSSNNLDGEIPVSLGDLSNLAELELNNNNLEGSIPSEFTSLTNLFSLIISNNNFTGLPDLSGLSSLSNLFIASNNLDFDDIIPNLSVPGIDASPQYLDDPGLDTTLLLGDNLTIDISAFGNNAGNEFQWRKDGVDVAGETTQILDFIDFQKSDEGLYELFVTNSSAPGIELISSSYNVHFRSIYYWVGDGGSWYDSTHWSLTSGVIDTTGLIPGLYDNVIFDENSFTQSGQVVEVPDGGNTSGTMFSNMDWTGVTNNPTFRVRADSSPWIVNDVRGSLIFDENMTLDFHHAEFYFNSPTDYVLDPKGHYMGEDAFVTFGLPGHSGEQRFSSTCNIQSDVNNILLFAAEGRVNSNGYQIIGQPNHYFWLWGGGNPTVDVSGSNVDLGYIVIQSGEFIDDDATITIRDSRGTRNVQQSTDFNHVIAADTIELGHSNIYQTLEILPGAGVRLSPDNTQFVNNLIADGTNEDPILISSTVDSLAGTFSKASGEVNIRFATIENNIATGGATFNAISSLDSGNVTGWNFIVAQPVQASDSLALVAFYQSTNGDNWFDNNNWLQPGRYVEEWLGVSVENNRVIGLDLRGNGLSGTLPPEIGDLDSLRVLNLGQEGFGGNQITGSIPSEISNLSKLEFIGLAENQLSGAIPEAIGSLTELKKLDFTFNELESVPDAISALSKIKYLGIAFNNFTDLPLAIYNIPSLDTLLISGNELSGPIPPELGTMTTLKFLNIGGNQYEGQLPPELGNLTQLQGLRVWDMPGITGNIPPEWAALTSIEEFSLDNLSLSGTIPDFIGNYTSAYHISLQGNQFSGAIPDSFQNLSSFTNVYLFSNAITSVPELGNLAFIDLRKNRLLYADLVNNDSVSVNGYDEQNERYSLDVSGVITGGGAVTLTVTNSDLGDNAFQWIKDTEILDGEVSPSLVLTNLDESHNGVYTCLVHRPEDNFLYAGIPSESVSIDLNETDRRYASAVDSVTSSAKIIDYQASEILGLPNRGTDSDDNPTDQISRLDAQERGWAPAAADNQPFIEVNFGSPAPINTVWVFGSGSVSSIEAKDSNTGEYEVISNFFNIANNGSETEVNFPTTAYDVSEVRVNVFSAPFNEGYGPFNSIDAVAIGDNGLEISTPFNLFLGEKVTDSIFNIGWSHHNNDDSTSFSVERSVDGTNFSEVALVEAGFTGLSDREVPASDSIFYRVKAIRGSIESEYSEVLIIENCPSNLTDFPVGSWTGIVEEITPIFGVSGFDDNVQITDNGNGTYTINDFMASYLSDGFGFQDPNIGTLGEGCNGLNFQGELVAGCGNNTVISNIVEFYPASDSLVIEFTWDCGGDIRMTFTKNASEPAQDPPTNLTASTVSSSAIQLMWEDNTNEDEWVIERSDGDNLNYLEIDVIVPNPQSETGFREFERYIDNTVSSGNTYYYRVLSRSGGLDSEPSDEVSIEAIAPLFDMVTSGPIVDDQPSNSYAGSWGDYDADGDPDLYVTNWHAGIDIVKVTKENYLYENNGGVFSRVSLSNELTDAEYTSRGTFWGDFDNDGNLDAFVNGEGVSDYINEASSYLFYGNGSGGFDAPYEFNALTFNSTPVDINGDGLLDIYVTDVDIILENKGDRNFEVIRDGSSIINGDYFLTGWTNLTPDFNNDGLPDLISSGDRFIQIFENKGDFLYERIYEISNAIDPDMLPARGATFGDFDHNGYLDIVVANVQESKLFLFDGTGIAQILDDIEFLGEEIHAQRGLTVADYNNDGNEDLFWILDGGQPYLFTGNGDGTFNRVSETEQIFAETSIFSSISTADFNQDGAIDVFISSTDDSRSNSLYSNNGNGNNHLRIDLEGTESNRLAIGSQIRIKHGGQWYMKQVTGVNGLWSSNEITTHFGLGTTTTVDSVEIRWTSGNVNTFTDIAANQTITYVEDVTPPVVEVDVIGTSVTSPELTGLIDDINATLELTINDSTYLVTNINADSTWSLPAGTIPSLDDGVYDVALEATDQNGNVGVDDVVGEVTITQELLALVPSKITSSSFQANWSEALDVQEYLLDVATDAEFTTFVDGYEDFSTTSQKKIVDNLDFSTTYYYRVRFVNSASETSDYSNDTTVLTKIKLETISDFNALETIFNATGGENWTNDGGWTTEPRLQNWEFVTLENQRVKEILIPDNNLTGTFPLTDSLTKVEVIDISDNELTGIGNLSELVSLNDLNVSQNLFEFDDLEPLRGIQNFTYADQKTQISFEETKVADSLLVRVFNDTSLTFTVGGEFNSYQWLLNKTSITSGEDFVVGDTILQIQAIDYTNMGKFEAEITNDSLPDLTLRVDSMFVFAVADFSVDVNDDDGELIPDNVDGYLLLTTQVERGFDTLSVATNQPSSFTFNDVILGDYLISIDSDPAKYVPTYYADAFEWVEADTVLFRKDTAFQVSMTLIPGETEGPGTLEVLIEEDFGETSGRIDARRRAAKRKCGLRRKRSGGRTGQDDDDFELIAYGETDQNGEFKFGSLPEGVYRFFVEYPGIPLDESSFVQFEVGEEGISDTDFKLEAFVTEDGVQVSIERVLGLILEYFKNLQVYPNPTADVIKMQYRHLKDKDVAAQLVDLSGNVLWTKDIRSGYEGYEEIDVSAYREGIYMLHIYDKEDRNGHVVSYRIIVRKN
ncbi:Repeat domain-containing protein [Ekhidna lutea]|uniref:Repeat domain-containing protein n=1 Tax=Ekhidna lutea TaxID=447679 RepID=A0A239EXT0_EKHLU|nr:FG-GAP-like repeat-containing protein [Ekhidna lutea]SNS48843.1 Repeat domain-containing protein [Ekhidna lutea]